MREKRPAASAAPEGGGFPGGACIRAEEAGNAARAELSAPSVGAAAKPPVFTAPRGQQKQGSALSDDLLANLNALLNGGQEP